MIATGPAVIGDLVGELVRDREAVSRETQNLAARPKGSSRAEAGGNQLFQFKVCADANEDVGLDKAVQFSFEYGAKLCADGFEAE